MKIANATPSDSPARGGLTLFRVALVVLALVILGLAVGFAFGLYREKRSLSILGAGDYPAVREALISRMPHMPASIPAGATGVRIYAPGAIGGFLPMPDKHVEVRMVLSPAAAAAVAATAVARGHTYPSTDPRWAGVPECLQTAHDQDPSTPLPQGFVSFSNGRLRDTFVGRITVNVTTGEVIYWSKDR